jgi:hypothetical protein
MTTFRDSETILPEQISAVGRIKGTRCYLETEHIKCCEYNWL